MILESSDKARESVADLKAAAGHIDDARTSLMRAVFALKNPDRAGILMDCAKKLQLMAQEFHGHRLTAGLAQPLLSNESAASLLGRSRSEKKLAALAKARQALAEKRAAQKALVRPPVRRTV